jgi:hypothetical protein
VILDTNGLSAFAEGEPALEPLLRKAAQIAGWRRPRCLRSAMPRRGTSKNAVAASPQCPTGPFGRSQTPETGVCASLPVWHSPFPRPKALRRMAECIPVEISNSRR